jgi:hypothetical protein
MPGSSLRPASRAVSSNSGCACDQARYTLAIRPLAVITPGVRAIIRALSEMDPPTPLEGPISTPGDLFETVNLNAWLEVGNRFGSSPLEP